MSTSRVRGASVTTSPRDPGRAHIVGLGLIGGSIGLALRALGWQVSGEDVDDGVVSRAVATGAVDGPGTPADVDRADLVFVATPVAAIPVAASAVLERPGRQPGSVVTDVGGVKGPIVAALDRPGFVGGHPMAGSEQSGIEGADAELFVGATWVLTPTVSTEPEGYTLLRSVISELGADVVELSPAGHDELVAVVSHVPHLTAATLMNLAADQAVEHAALLRLAAGGFRDMTRIAAGQPGIWPDICVDNAGAIVATLDQLIESLGDMRARVARGDRAALLDVLGRATVARRALGVQAEAPDHLAEMRVPVRDDPGAIAEVTTLAAELGINIADVEIAHSVEGDRGVLVLTTPAGDAPRLADALTARGYRAAVTPVGTR